MRSAREILTPLCITSTVPLVLGDNTFVSSQSALRAIEQAQREAIEEAAKLADPPLMHRKGVPGLWRQRRAAIAAAIRALGDQL